MKIIGTLLCLMCPFIALSQKIKTDNVDKFNGVRTIATTDERLTNFFSLTQTEQLFCQGYVFADSTDRSYSLFFSFPSTFTGSLTDEAEVTLLLENGARMVLPYKGKYKLFSPKQVVLVPVRVDRGQLESLKNNKVTDVRITTSSVSDFKIKSKQQDILPNIANLLLTVE